jgi:protein-disulfide isomerase
MLFRIFLILMVLASGGAIYKIATLSLYYHDLRTPPAEFLAQGSGEDGPIIVEFIDYVCDHCNAAHIVMLDYIAKNPGLRYISRPMASAEPAQNKASSMALAAGMQGKFREFDRALSEYGTAPDDKFYRETAALYDLDYERMQKDAQSEAVQSMLKENEQAFFKAGFETVPAFIIGKTFHALDKPLTESDVSAMVRGEQNNP